MNESKKVITSANIKVKDGYVTLFLHMPIRWKWIMLILVSALMYFLPDFWRTIQIAISVIP